VRTTVDLPPAVHRRAVELARARGVSLSATIAELTVRGLGELDESFEMRYSDVSGWPVVNTGHGPITSEDVARMIDEDE
jgi:hypothetical protein